MPKSNYTNQIYLDYASGAPVDPRVLKVMNEVGKHEFANPSAIHELGVRAKKILERARGYIAKILGAHANEIIFTSGATESNNLAILGVGAPHIVTTNIEHASVLEVCKYLEKTKKAQITYVEVEKNGIVDPKKIKKAIKKNTVLVSVMYANNEIGTIQPIREIAKEIRHFNKINSKKILFHTDATQAINYLPVNVEKLGVDLLSFNGAKIYGPKGVGVLFKKRNLSLAPITHGGDQEFGFRPGTENLLAIAGLAEAFKITEALKEKESKRLVKLRDYFIKKIKDIDSEVILNGDKIERLPNNVNISIPKIPSELLVLELSARGIMISARSACKSLDRAESHVIKAIRPTSKIEGSVRFSIGRETTKTNLDYVSKSLFEILTKLKRWYN
jgi:cysteine desulfurase